MTPWTVIRKNDFYQKNIATKKHGPIHVVLARLPREWIWDMFKGSDQSGNSVGSGYIRTQEEMDRFEARVRDLEEK